MGSVALFDEIWKPVVGYEKQYEISSFGRLRRASKGTRGMPAGTILKPQANRSGRLGFRLCKDSKYKIREVHCLVAEAFIGPRPEGMEINHKNGIKTDNRVDNLEYCTHSENMRHAWRTGLFRPRHKNGETHHASKLSEAQAVEVLNCRGVESPSSVASRYGITSTAVQSIWNRKNWKYLNAENLP